MRKGIMLANPFSLIRFHKWGSPVFIQPKLDGDRCRAILRRGEPPLLLSSEENIITSIPHVNDQLSQLEDVELDGELYTEGASHDDIRSAVSRRVNFKDSSDVSFHIFDLVDETLPQWQRFDRLNGTLNELKNAPNIKRVSTLLLSGQEALEDAVNSSTSRGYEGIIIRHPSALYARKRSIYMMKWKPRKEDYYKIIGVFEEISIKGEPKNALGAIVCENEPDGEKFGIGSGEFLTRERRIELWREREQLPGMYAHIKYQRLTPGRKVPYHSVLVDVLSGEEMVKGGDIIC